MNIFPRTLLFLLVASIVSAQAANTVAADAAGRTFAEDVALLKQHNDVIVLSDVSGKNKLAIVPAYQGRVMTSTNNGDDAPGFGWIDEEAVKLGPVAPHMNAFGGEDRFWIAPEAGQYAIFFKAGESFDVEHWQTPPLIDTVPYKVVEKTARSVIFHHTDSVTNYSGTKFDVEIDRRISLLDREVASHDLGTKIPPNVDAVVYLSQNTLTNAGKQAWKKESGLLSIWILGMLKASPQVTVVAPFNKGDANKLGAIVNDNYFGKVPADRLSADEEHGVVYFKGDGVFRSKIGLLPQRAKGVIACYDPVIPRLTIVKYTQPKGATLYPNSMWELQDNPYGGDAINSYNHKPTEDGSGTFYELETASPGKELAPGESIRHTHQTMHFTGPKAELDAIAKQVLGVGVDEIVGALP